MHKTKKYKKYLTWGIAGLLLAVAPASAAADGFYPVATAVAPGSTATMAINLDNSVEVKGFQADITLPEGLTAGSFSLTDRSKGFAFTKTNNGNKYRVVAYNVDGEAVSGSKGAVLEVALTASSDYRGGSVKLDNIILPGVNDESLEAPPISMPLPTEGPANIVAVADLDVIAGIEKEVSVILSNETPAAGLMLDVKLPAGVTIVPGSLSLTDRADGGWTLSSRAYDDGNNRIVAVPGQEDIAAGAGAILTFRLAATDLAPGESVMTVSGTFTLGDETYSEMKFPTIEVPLTVTVVKVSEITCAPGEANLTMEAGDTHTYSLSVMPREAYNKALNWNVTPDGVVALSPDGTIRALAVGSADITVTAADGDGAELALHVEVIPTYATGLEIICTGSPDIYVDQTLQLTAQVSPENATERSVEWTSLNPDVATVDAGGVVTGMGEGSATIQASVKTAPGSDNVLTAQLKVRVFPVPARSISIDVPSLALQKGDRHTLTATVLPETATYRDITWSSSGAEVATVDEFGIVTAKSPGVVEITATQKENHLSATITVTVLDRNTLSLGGAREEGEKRRLDIIAGQETEVTVWLDNTSTFVAYQFDLRLPEEITMVPESAVAVKGDQSKLHHREYADGTIRFIYLNDEGLQSDDPAAKGDGAIPPELNPGNILLGGGAFLSLKVVATDKAAAESEITLSNALFTNKDLAELGVACAPLSLTVTVVPVGSITLKEGDVTLNGVDREMEAGDSFTLEWEVGPELAYNKAVTVTSTNPDVATVDIDGTVRALKVGETTITVATTDGSEVSSYVNIIVKETQPKSVQVSPWSVNLKATQTVRIEATVYPANATDKSVTWRTSDESVATVSEDGTVTAVAVGEAKVTATDVAGNTASCKVTVNETLVEEIALSRNRIVITRGNEEQLSATVYPETATDPGYIWESDDESVATVEDGLVTAVAKGKTVIKAVAQDGSGVVAECEVFVTGVNRVAFAGSDSEIPDVDEPLKIIEAAPYHESLAYVTLENEDAYNGFQLDIVMPEGAEILADSWRIVGQEDQNGFIISGRNYPDGVTRLIGLRMSGGSGEGDDEDEDNALFGSLEEGSEPANVISFIVVKSADASEAPEADAASEVETYRDLEVKLMNVTFCSTDDVEQTLDDATGIIRLYDVLPMRLRKTVKYSFGEQEQAWSSNGMTYGLHLEMADDEEALILENVAVVLEPGSDGEWMLPTDVKPAGVEDANWDEWQALISEDNYVDGFWEPEKVVATIDEGVEGDSYEVNVMLPCSGRYTFGLVSDRYRFERLVDGEDDFLVAYPSVKNFWTAESYKNESGEYLPLCLNIEGIPMKNDGESLSEEWVMEFPFVDGKIWNHDNLHRSVVYPTGVFLAEIWTKSELNESTGNRVKRQAETTTAALEDNGYTKGQTVDLTQLATKDGLEPDKSYDVSIVLKKNGAMTPLENDGKSTEYFTVTSSKDYSVPTGIESVDGDAFADGPVEIYTLDGHRLTCHPELLTPGIYIMRRGISTTKLVIK